MSGKETDYAKLWGKIKDGAYTMADSILHADMLRNGRKYNGKIL